MSGIDISPDEIAAEWQRRRELYVARRDRFRSIALICLLLIGVGYAAAHFIVGPARFLRSVLVLLALMCLVLLSWSERYALLVLKCPRCHKYPVNPWVGSGMSALTLSACDNCLAPLVPLVAWAGGRAVDAGAAAPEDGPRAPHGVWLAAGAACRCLALIALGALYEHHAQLFDPEWLTKVLPLGLATNPGALLVIAAVAWLASWLFLRPARGG